MKVGNVSYLVEIPLIAIWILYHIVPWLGTAIAPMLWLSAHSGVGFSIVKYICLKIKGFERKQDVCISQDICTGNKSTAELNRRRSAPDTSNKLLSSSIAQSAHLRETTWKLKSLLGCKRINGQMGLYVGRSRRLDWNRFCQIQNEGKRDISPRILTTIFSTILVLHESLFQFLFVRLQVKCGLPDTVW